MTEIYFKNLDVSKEKEIKIYSLGKDDTLPLSSQFTSLDNFNKAIGIKLLAANGSVISCVGATKLFKFADNGNPNEFNETDIITIKFTVNGTQSIEFDYYNNYLGDAIQSNLDFSNYLASIGLNVYDTEPGDNFFINLLNTSTTDIRFTLEIDQSKSTMTTPTKISDIYTNLAGGAVTYVSDDKIAGCIGTVDQTYYINCADATHRLYWLNNVWLNGETEVIVSWTIAGVTTTANYVSDTLLSNISLFTIMQQQLNINIPGFYFQTDGWLLLKLYNTEESGHNPDLENVRISINCSDGIVTIPDIGDESSPALWLSDDNKEMKLCLAQQTAV